MMRFLVLILLAVGVIANAHAADGSIQPGSTGPRATTVNGKTVFNWTQTGTSFPSVAGTPAGTNAIQYGNLGIAKASTGGLNAGSRVSMPLPGAREAPIDVVGRMSPGKLIKGARILSKLFPIVQIATVAPELYDWFNDSGVQFNPDATGDSDAFLRKDTTVCTVAPCNEYRPSNMTDTAANWFKTTADACQAAGTSRTQQSGTYTYTWTGQYVGAACRLRQTLASSPSFELFTNQAYTTRTVAPSPESWVPSSEAEVLSQLEQNSPGPGIARNLFENGVPVDVEDVSVSGPASVPGETSQATQANGNVHTTNTTYKINYEGNTVNVTRSDVTNIYNPETGETTTEESEQEETIDTPVDTALPDVPKLYERKYPDGLAGVWTARKAEVMAQPLAQLSNNFFPTITGSNACPQFSIHLDMGIRDFGTLNLGPPCFVWDFMKMFLIISALFWARRLIFGG